MLTLFSAVFDVLTKYAQTDGILLPNFTKLVRHCLTAASNAANPTGEPYRDQSVCAIFVLQSCVCHACLQTLHLCSEHDFNGVAVEL